MEATPRDLVRELILAERLTRFLAEAVYRGHTKGLVMGELIEGLEACREPEKAGDKLAAEGSERQRPFVLS